MTFVWAAVLILVLLIGWVLTVVGMPGNLLMCGAAALYAWLMPADSVLTFGWGVVLVMVALMAVGEIIEQIAGALGVAKRGGSKRGAILAMLGSFGGAIVGVFVSLPIPVVGWIFGAVLFAAIGALVGAVLGERWKGRELGESWEIGKAAFWGRLLGMFAKTMIGLVMIVTAIVGMCV